MSGANSLRWGVWLLMLTLSGCATTVESLKIEDRARRTLPVPICLKPLARYAGDGVVSTLTPKDYWELILPGFDASTETLNVALPDCAGRSPFSEDLAGADSPRTDLARVKLDDASVSPAADGLRIVWLRSHHFADGTAAGPLALVRARAGYAEVYATGFYRGRERDSRFSLERMGPRLLVTIADDGCSGVKPKQACETAFSVYLLRAGQLLRRARFALDRIDYLAMSGPGESAQVRLTASPVFQADALRVSEQVVVTDPGQGVLRKTDLERVFRLQRDDHLISTQDSLWSRVTGPSRSTDQ